MPKMSIKVLRIQNQA